MDNNFCKYCGGENRAKKDTKLYGNHTALICSKCGRWQKWLSKKELQDFLKEPLPQESVPRIEDDLPFSLLDTERESVEPSILYGAQNDDDIEKLRNQLYEAMGVKKEVIESAPNISLKVLNDNAENLLRSFAITYRASVPFDKEGILRESQNFYGEGFEKNIAIEELSELIKELAKDFRGIGDSEHIAEEVADVYIMLRQLEIMYKNSNRVQYYIDEKIKRLDERMEHEKKSNDRYLVDKERR